VLQQHRHVTQQAGSDAVASCAARRGRGRVIWLRIRVGTGGTVGVRNGAVSVGRRRARASLCLIESCFVVHEQMSRTARMLAPQLQAPGPGLMACQKASTLQASCRGIESCSAQTYSPLWSFLLEGHKVAETGERAPLGLSNCCCFQCATRHRRPTRHRRSTRPSTQPLAVVPRAASFSVAAHLSATNSARF
jgi:hypothetical protein